MPDETIGEYVRRQCLGGHDCEDGWVCEQHPDRSFPHGDCAGPGMPCSTRTQPDRLPEDVITAQQVVDEVHRTGRRCWPPWTWKEAAIEILAEQGLDMSRYDLVPLANIHAWRIVRRDA